MPSAVSAVSQIAILLLATLVLGVVPGRAQGPPSAEAMLTIRGADTDEQLTLTGRVIAFDGEYLRIDTIYGPLTLAAEGLECVGPGCPDLAGHVGGFTVAGSSALGMQLLPDLLTAWAESRGMALVAEAGSQPDIATQLLIDPETGEVRAEIRFRMGRGEEGLIALLTGSADIALTFDTWRDASVRSQIVGLDGLVPLVAADNPVRVLALSDLVGILSGLITDWSRLGGVAGPIVLHLGPSDVGLDQLPPGLLPEAPVSAALRVVRHADEAALASAVARDPTALGLGRWSQRGDARAVPFTGNCSVVIRPRAEVIRSEDWPLTLPLQVYVGAVRAGPELRDFLRFLTRPEARAAARRAGLVDLSAAPQPLSAQGERLADAVLAAGPDVPLQALQGLLRRLAGASRLSYTFRFEVGSASLDAISDGVMRQLAVEAAAGAFDGSRLIFVGFTDSAGNAGANRRLSLDRARAAAAAFSAAVGSTLEGRVEIEAVGFGEAMPIACDDTAIGRHVNRRVELWLR